MDTEPVRSYARVGKRRQRRPFTIMVAIAIVACFLAIGLLIAFEKAGDRKKGAQETLDQQPGFAGAIAALLPHEDPDLVAVRAWLKENLNVPEWVEVRWWPGREMIEWRAEEIRAARIGVDNAIEGLKEAKDASEEAKKNWRANSKKGGVEYANSLVASTRENVKEAMRWIDTQQAELERVSAATPLRRCRLKYRTKNAMGATVLEDDLFALENGKATKANMGGVQFFPTDDPGNRAPQ